MKINSISNVQKRIVILILTIVVPSIRSSDKNKQINELTTPHKESIVKKYDEDDFLKRKCEYYQKLKIKDRDAFLAWIYKQWGPDQFDLEDEFRSLSYDQLYERLLQRFNSTHHQIYFSCRNTWFPKFNDTRERTHREEFRAIYLIHREYMFKLDHWFRWLVDHMPYYVKKLRRDRIARKQFDDGKICLDEINTQLEYERRIDAQAYQCKKEIRQILYRHGNSTLEEFAYEVVMGEMDFIEFNAAVREDFIKRCNMFLNLRQKHHEHLQYKKKSFLYDDNGSQEYITRFEDPY